MCTVSMITDHFREKWQPQVPGPYQVPYPPNAIPWPSIPLTPQQPIDLEQLNKLLQPKAALPTAEEIAAFRADMAEFKSLLERAREYDARNNEPNCELESKKAALKAIADHFGVAIDFL